MQLGVRNYISIQLFCSRCVVHIVVRNISRYPQARDQLGELPLGDLHLLRNDRQPIILNYHSFNNLNYVTGITYLIIAIVIKYISETSVAQVPAIALYKKLGYQCASIYLDTKNMLKNSIFIAVGISLVACYKKL